MVTSGGGGDGGGGGLGGGGLGGGGLGGGGLGDGGGLGGGDGGGGAFMDDPTTGVTLVSCDIPLANSCAFRPPPVTAASRVLAVVEARSKSRNDTVYATFTAVCARVLTGNTRLVRVDQVCRCFNLNYRIGRFQGILYVDAKKTQTTTYSYHAHHNSVLPNDRGV